MSSEPTEDIIRRLVSSLSPADRLELVNTLLDRAASDAFAFPPQPEPPTLLRKPRKVRGFQVRVDLRGVKPPIWRRLILPGDLTLDRVHAVVNEAMGWAGGHLHRFSTGNDPRSPYFITEFDLEEGDEGILENDVRLDQIVAEKGDVLWYDYDFGDGWEHTIKVEAVLPDPPDGIELVTGRRTCPPEDVGGPWAYQEIAAWVESGYDDALLPDHFDDAEHARDWLPLEWHPATFDLEATRTAVQRVFDALDDGYAGFDRGPFMGQ